MKIEQKLKQKKKPFFDNSNLFVKVQRLQLFQRPHNRKLYVDNFLNYEFNPDTNLIRLWVVLCIAIQDSHFESVCQICNSTVQLLFLIQHSKLTFTYVTKRVRENYFKTEKNSVVSCDWRLKLPGLWSHSKSLLKQLITRNLPNKQSWIIVFPF